MRILHFMFRPFISPAKWSLKCYLFVGCFKQTVTFKIRPFIVYCSYIDTLIKMFTQIYEINTSKRYTNVSYLSLRHQYSNSLSFCYMYCTYSKQFANVPPPSPHQARTWGWGGGGQVPLCTLECKVVNFMAFSQIRVIPWTICQSIVSNFRKIGQHAVFSIILNKLCIFLTK